MSRAIEPSSLANRLHVRFTRNGVPIGNFEEIHKYKLDALDINRNIPTGRHSETNIFVNARRN